MRGGRARGKERVSRHNNLQSYKTMEAFLLLLFSLSFWALSIYCSSGGGSDDDNDNAPSAVANRVSHLDEDTGLGGQRLVVVDPWDGRGRRPALPLQGAPRLVLLIARLAQDAPRERAPVLPPGSLPHFDLVEAIACRQAHAACEPGESRDVRVWMMARLCDVAGKCEGAKGGAIESLPCSGLSHSE